jgi:hypothetical protein
VGCRQKEKKKGKHKGEMGKKILSPREEKKKREKGRGTGHGKREKERERERKIKKRKGERFFFFTLRPVGFSVNEFVRPFARPIYSLF